MLLTQSNDILFAHQRFAAGKNVHIGAQFLALGDDGIQFFQGQVQAVAVLCRPAAGAVHIAGRGGVQQDSPGHVAVFLAGNFVLAGTALQAGIDDKVAEEGLPHTGVQFIDLHDQLVPVVLFVDGVAERGALLGVPVLGGNGIDQFHDLGNVGFRVLFQIVQNLFEAGRDCGIFQGCILCHSKCTSIHC